MTTRILSTITAVVLAGAALTGCTSRVDRLSKNLQSNDKMVRWTAAEELGKTGDPKAVPPLLDALDDERLEVAWTAADSLGKLGQPAVEPLTGLLSDASPRKRQLAAFALGLIAEPTTAGALSATLKNDEIPAVRAEAAMALGHIGTPTAKAALEEAQGDSNADVVQAATKALERIMAMEAEAARQAEMNEQNGEAETGMDETGMDEVNDESNDDMMESTDAE